MIAIVTGDYSKDWKVSLLTRLPLSSFSIFLVSCFLSLWDHGVYENGFYALLSAGQYNQSESDSFEKD